MNGQFTLGQQLAVAVLLLWTLPWKGVALWKAARNNHQKWFIALLVLQTLAVLDILYIFVFGKVKKAAKGEPRP